MPRRLVALILIPLFVSCSTPTSLRKKHVTDISSISVAVNVLLANDVSGFTDSVDVIQSRQLATSLQNQITQLLESKGYHCPQRHISVARVTSDESFYVIESEADRQLKLKELAVREGTLYSDWLSGKELKSLHKAVIKKKDAPPLIDMGFNSDATLVAMLDGRTIGDGKAVGAIIGNIAIFTLEVLAAAAGGHGGSSSGMDIDDTFRMKLRLFSSANGDLLWKTDFKVNKLEDVATENFMKINERIPHK